MNRVYPVLWLVIAVFLYRGYCAAAEKPTPFATTQRTASLIKANKVEFKKAENKVIFNGDVVITRGDDVIYSDSAVKDEKENVIDAWGNVRGYFILESTAPSRIKAEKARWDIDTGRVKLEGNPEIVYLSTSTGEIAARSDLLTIEDSTREAYFNGNVLIHYGKSIAESNVARYSHGAKRIELQKDETRTPFVKYSSENRGDFRADTINIYFGDKKMTLEKNVECLIYQ